MKKLLALVLTLGALLALGAPALAADAVVVSPQSLAVDGAAVICEKYNIGGRNYFKLRDLAQLLDGTGSQFDVGWDEAAGLVSITTRHPYTTPDGHELEPRGDLSATAQETTQTVCIDGTVRTDLSVWNIGGSNFFQLRELGTALGFAVDYDDGSDTALVMSIEQPAHVHLVGVGETAWADLDGDGTANAVRFWMARTEYGWFDAHLSIDGADCSEAMYAARGGYHFDCPDEIWWAVTDLDTDDGLLEIAVQDWGPSDDLTTSFFRYDGKDLTYLGAPEGFLYFSDGPGSMTLAGDGTLQSEMRLHVLQTWWTTVRYDFGGDGLLVPVPQTFYVSNTPNQPVTTRCDLWVYDAPGGTRSVLPAGTRAALYGTDDAHFVLLKKLADGADAWLYLPDGYALEAPGENVYGWEALEGLSMAD